MEEKAAPIIQMIPVELITVVNPRVRNRKVFNSITENIAELGLKRPITVTRRDDKDGTRYELVCGQGRLEAFQALGQRLIPAIVIEAGTEDCMVMSLVENLARRQHRAIDLLHDIQGLKQRGYTEPQIAEKTGLTHEYVRVVIRLLETGEHRLLRAVEAGQIPVSVAAEIAGADDEGVQRALQQAYESKLLRGRKFIQAKRLIEQRRRRGKGLSNVIRIRNGSVMSSASLVRAYQEDVHRKRSLIRKTDVARDRLVFVMEALRTLFSDENFVTLLRAEELETLPTKLADRMRMRGGSRDAARHA